MRKNLLKISALLCCVVLAAAVFTSCSDDDDDITKNYVIYTAEGVTNELFAITDYTAAISNAVPSGKDDDAAVITACDKVYSSHKASKPNLTGEVRIMKYRGLMSSPDEEQKPEKTVKVYKYN